MQFGTPQGGLFADDIAKYVIVVNTPAGSQVATIYLVRGIDGIWRIEGI